MAAEDKVQRRRYTRKQKLESDNLRLHLEGGGGMYVYHRRDIMEMILLRHKYDINSLLEFLRQKRTEASPLGLLQRSVKQMQ